MKKCIFNTECNSFCVPKCLLAPLAAFHAVRMPSSVPCDFLSYAFNARQLLPAKTTVFLVGDTEFGSIRVLKQLEQWRWYYALRQKGSTKIWTHADRGWISFSTVLERVGQSVWLGAGYLTESNIHPASLLAHLESRRKGTLVAGNQSA